MDAASLRVKFEAVGGDAVVRESNKASGAIGSLTEKAGKLGSALSVAGGILLAKGIETAVSGAKSLVSGFISANAQAEKMMLSLETVTGSQERAASLFDDLKKFAATTPFQFPELVQSAINLEAFGMKTEEWLTTIGDTASAMGKSVDQVTQAVLDASTGEFERLKELGIKASVEGDKILFRYMHNGQEMVKEADRNSQEMITATVQGIWNEKYAGAMEKQSKSFLGLWSTLKDNVNAQIKEMGEGVFEWAKTGLKHAVMFFDRFNRLRERGLSPFTAGMKALKWSLDDAFGRGMGGVIFGTLETITRGIGAALGAIRDFGAGLVDFSRYIAAILQDGDLMNDWLTHLPEPIRRTAHAFGSLVDVAADVLASFQRGGLDAAIRTFFQGGELEQAAGAILALADEAWGLFRRGVEAAAGVAIELGSVIINALPELGSGLADIAGDVWGWIKRKLLPGQGDGTGGPDFDAGRGNLIDIGKVLISAAVDAAGDLLGWAASHWSTVEGWIKDGLNTAEGLAVDLGVILLGATIEASDKLNGWLSQNTRQLVAWIKSDLAEPVAIGALAVGASVVLGPVSLVGWIAALASKFKEEIGASVSFASEIGGAIADKIRGVPWSTIFSPVNLANFGSELGVKLREAIIAGGTWVAELGVEIATKVKEAVTNLEITAEDLKSLGGKIVDALATAIKTMLLAPITIGAAIFSVITGAVFGLATGRTIDEIDWGDIADKIIGGIGGAITGGVDYATELAGDIADLIGDVPGHVGDVSETLADKGRDLINGLKTGADGAWNDVVSWLQNRPSQMAAQFSTKIDEAIETLKGEGKKLINGVLDGVQARVDGLSGESLKNSLLGWVGKGIGKLIEAIGRIDLAAIATAINDAVGAVVDKLSGESAKNSLIAWIVRAAEKVAGEITPSTFTDLGAAIGKAIIDAIGQFIRDNWNPWDWINNDGSSSSEESGGARGYSAPLPPGGGVPPPPNAFGGVGGGIASLLGGVDTTALTQPFEDARAEIEKTMAAMRANVANELVGLRGDADTITTGLRNQSANTFVGMRNDLTTLSESTRRDVADSFAALQGDLSRTAGRMADSMTRPFNGIAGQMVRIGWDIGNGLARGLWDKVDNVSRAAAALANAVRNTTTRSLGIASPSRVMMQLGAFTAEGFARGILGGEREVNAAMASMLRLPTFRGGLGGGFDGGGAFGRAAAPVINVYMDARGSLINRDALAEVRKISAQEAGRVVNQRMAWEGRR